MKKAKIVVSMLAVVCGAGAAVSVNAGTSSSAITYDWIDWNGQVVLYGMTQAEAQQMCAPTTYICLRAKENVFIYTTGTLPW